MHSVLSKAWCLVEGLHRSVVTLCKFAKHAECPKVWVGCRSMGLIYPAVEGGVVQEGMHPAGLLDASYGSARFPCLLLENGKVKQLRQL